MSLYDEYKKEKHPEAVAPEPEKHEDQFVNAHSLMYFTICKNCGSKFSKRLIRCPECNTKNKGYIPRPVEGAK